uniref:Uncharacterized protein n=1 Tax=Strombidium inclinatum TaxID=197538 RepID=A0A7S3ILI2_9SPIT|mmetsp:Transcript_26743/g.40806  ORF Transcript_26743/g.40806 Transcript_26743/m.40806 type:complete len:157 (+) Transcript_26743:28-498(+)
MTETYGDTKKGGFSVREPANSCCCCIPIGLGVRIIGFFILLEALAAAWVTFTYIITIVKIVFGIVYAISFLPIFMSAFYFIRFYQNDTMKTRAKLPVACLYMIFSLVVSLCWSALGMLLFQVSISKFFDSLIFSGVSAVLFFYFIGVCKRFAESAN